MKEDREEQRSWEEKVANSIEQRALERCEFDSVSVGELRAFGAWRGCLFCVCGLGSTGVLFF